MAALHGTCISVMNLFENYPVRRQVMQQKGDETKKKVNDLITSYALIRPNVRFELICSGNQTFLSNGNQSELDCITQIYGPNFTKELTKFEFLSQDEKWKI